MTASGRWGLLVGTLVVSSFLAWGCRQPERVAAVQSAPQKNAAVEVVEEYWPNGKLRVRHEVRRQPDSTLVDHGAYTSWFDNGGKEYEAAFVNGKVNGVATRWHRNGVKASEQAYVLGQRHGPRFVWDENGRLRKEEHFVDDLPDGTWTTWNDEGQIKAQQKFERGAPK